MKTLVDCVIEDSRWQAIGLPALAETAVGAVFSALGLPDVGLNLCLMGCDDARILALNADFRGKAKPTNVLSWPSWDLAPDVAGAMPDPPEPGTDQDPESLGDIAIAFDTCAREAEADAMSMAAHVTHLVVHGTLHLLGYDHDRDPDAVLMESTEVRILATLGISDPYE